VFKNEVCQWSCKLGIVIWTFPIIFASFFSASAKSNQDTRAVWSGLCVRKVGWPQDIF